MQTKGGGDKFQNVACQNFIYDRPSLCICSTFPIWQPLPASHLELILDAVGHGGGISAHLRNPVRLDLLPGKQTYKCPNLVPVDLDVALVMRDLQEDQAATNRCRRHLSHLKKDVAALGYYYSLKSVCSLSETVEN